MTIRRVPSAYATIQAAYTAAIAGDTIYLEAAGSPFTGATNKNISSDKALTYDADPGVIVDLQTSGCFISSHGAILTTCKNFEIRNGSRLTAAGGGIAVEGSLTLENMKFKACYAKIAGGGIAVPVGVCLMDGCVFENCWTSHAGVGGAASVGQATIRNSIFRSNNSPTFGGAVSSQFSNLTFENCLFCGNEVGVAGYGAAVSTYDQDISFKNCTFARNESGGFGGGVDIYDDDSLPHTANFTDCVFWENLATSGGNQAAVEFPNTVCTFDHVLCPSGVGDVLGTLAADFSRLTTDPFFVEADAEDFRLQHLFAGQASDSPAIGSGSRATLGSIVQGQSTRTDGYLDGETVDRGWHTTGNGKHDLHGLLGLSSNLGADLHAFDRIMAQLTGASAFAAIARRKNFVYVEITPDFPELVIDAWRKR